MMNRRQFLKGILGIVALAGFATPPVTASMQQDSATLPLPCSTKMPKVGIFFFIDNEILLDAVPVENGKPYGNAIQYGSHYEFWKNLIPGNSAERKLKARAYDAYPRGRVAYLPDEKQFCIFGAPCLKVVETMIVVAEEFQLENEDMKLDLFKD